MSEIDVTPDQPNDAPLREITDAFRREVDRLRRRKYPGETDRAGDDVSLPQLEFVEKGRQLRQRLRTVREQVREERKQQLRARADSFLQPVKQRREQLEKSSSQRREEVTAPAKEKYVVAGRVIDVETGEPVPQIRVQVMERDPSNDDVLGAVRTDEMGFYRLEYSSEDFHGPADQEPEAYIRVVDEDGNALFTSDQSFRHKAGTVEVIDAAVEAGRMSEKLEKGRQFRENVTAEVRALERRTRTLENRFKLRADPLSMLPPEEGES